MYTILFIEHVAAHLLLYLIALASSIGIARILYNRYWHPLKGYPGPWMASTSDFYKLSLFVGNDVHGKLFSLHQQYGPLVRIAPNLLSVSDPLQLPSIYTRNVDKTPFYSTGMAGSVAPLLLMQEHNIHSQMVKVFAPTMSAKFLRSTEGGLDVCISQVISKLRQHYSSTGQQVDLAQWVRWYIYDALTHIIYGKPAGMVASESDVRGLISNWHRMFKLGGLVGTLPWLVHPIINAPVLRRYFMPQKGQASGSGYIMSVHEQMFAPPSGKGSDDTEKVAITRPGNQSYHAPSLRANLSAAKMPDGSYLSPEEIQHQCYLNTVAGQDTTASLLNSLLSYVCADSRIYSSLMGEIGQLEARGHFSAIARYDETSEADMPYFNACVHETLRLAPPTPIPLPRYAPRGGSWVCESQVPGGTEIAANPWVIGRSKEAFGEDAECFKPERWIATGEAGSSRAGQDKQRVSRLKKFEFAWGFGDRRCVGRNIALFEANKFCVQLLREFYVDTLGQEKAKFKNIGVNMCTEQLARLSDRQTSTSPQEIGVTGCSA